MTKFNLKSFVGRVAYGSDKRFLEQGLSSVRPSRSRSIDRGISVWSVSVSSAVLAGQIMLLAAPAKADDATWIGGSSTSLADAANWSTLAVPTGTASFGAAPDTNLSVGSNLTMEGITLSTDAAAYTLSVGFFDSLTLTGAGIVINGGSLSITYNALLRFQNTSTAGSAAISNTNLLIFNDTSSAGSATVTNISGATVRFANSSTAGSATFVNNSNGAYISAIRFKDTSTAADSVITNNSTSYLVFENDSTAGQARITNNAGAVWFHDNSSAGTATITSNGDIIGFEDSATAGSANITLNADSSLNFYDYTTADHATITVNSGGRANFLVNSTGGAATITNNAGGIVDFSGSTGPLGDGKLSAGSIAGAGMFYLGGTELTVGSNNLSTTVSGVIGDCYVDCAATVLSLPTTGGALVKTGTGTLTLSAVNLYTGATTVNGGTLNVTGDITASSGVTVNTGGTLSGNGFVGNTTINDGGTLSASASDGALTVRGNLAFAAASTYMLAVTPANAGSVNVTGTASLGGATVNASFAAGSYITKQYTIVNATGGVIGTFGSQVNTNLPSNFTSSLSYDAKNAYLNLTLNYTPTPVTPEVPPEPTPGPSAPVYVPLNRNQNNVGNALVKFFNSTGGIPLVFGALGPSGLSQVSGEAVTGSQQTTFDAMSLFMGLMTDPFSAGRGDASTAAVPFADETMAYAATRKPDNAMAAIYRKAPSKAPAFQEHWNVWAAGFGGSRSTDGNAVTGSNNATSRIFGGAGGADYWFSPDTVAGFSLAGGGTTFSVANSGSGRSDLFQAGAFVRHNMASAYVTAAAAYGWQDITLDRSVTAAGLSQLRSQFTANAYSGRIETGNRFVMPWTGGVGLTPYAAAQVTAFDLPSYAETTVAGADTFALAYAGKTVTSTRSELGLRTDKSLAVKDAILTLRGRAAWAHDFNTDRNVAATFQTLPGASFVVNGAAQARDAALTTASAEMKFTNGLSLAATFEGEFSDVTRSYAGKGVVRYAW